MQNHQDDHNNHNGPDNTAEKPPMVDGCRPPQRNDENKSSHCSGGAKDGDGGSNDVVSMNATNMDDETSSVASDDEAARDGDEGTEQHLIEVGDLGYYPMVVILRAPVRPGHCICRGLILPNAEDYPFNSPFVSSLHSPSDSMIVEGQVSEDQSMMSSQMLSVRSASSSLLAFTGEGFTEEAVFASFPVVFNPLRLTPDFPADEFITYDMW